TGQVEALAFSADGKRIAAREWDGAISVWDVSGSRRAREVIGAGDQVRQEAISTDFKLVTRQLRHLYGDPDEMAISPDRTLIATGTADGIVRLWNARDKTPIGEPLTQSNLKKGEKSDIAVVYPVTLMWFSPDGKILHWRTSE